MGAVITGVGVALPEKTITNADLEARMDTTDAWIVERTGIHERRIGGTTAGLAAEAGTRALADAGLGPDDIDLLVLATTSPDRQGPGTSATGRTRTRDIDAKGGPTGGLEAGWRG